MSVSIYTCICTEAYWRWKSTASLLLWCIEESIRNCHLLKTSSKGKTCLWQPTFYEIESCTEVANVNATTRITGIVNWYEKPQVCIKRNKIGEYQDSRMDWFAICVKLYQDQEVTISLCSKQTNQNHEREECRVLPYSYEREYSRPTE